MTTCFEKMLVSNAVSGWKQEVLKSIHMHINTVLETLAVRAGQDCQAVLTLLDVIFRQNGSYHSRMWQYPTTRPFTVTRAPDVSLPYGPLYDYVNTFAATGGFERVLERSKLPGLTTQLFTLYLRPFGNCAKILQPDAIRKFLLPLMTAAEDHLTKLDGAALQAECNSLAQNESLDPLTLALRALHCQLTPTIEMATKMDQLYLSLILKLLKSDSYNGVMYALNEIKRLIDATRALPASANYTPSERPHETITAPVLSAWVIDNEIVPLLFKARLHQAQYVTKLEDVLRFLVNEQRLTLDHLDLIWQSQENKHESIVSNIFDLLARLAFTFEPAHLDHLFTRFQAGWGGTGRAMERMLGFVQRLAAEDSEGNMANKVLQLLWSMARDTTTTSELSQTALNAHRNILKETFVKDRETIIQAYVVECIKDLLAGQWVVPALRHMRQLLDLIPAGNPNFHHAPTRTRADVIKELQSQHHLQECILAYLSKYCELARKVDIPKEELSNSIIEGNFVHRDTLDELFTALRLLACEGHISMPFSEFDKLWTALVLQPPCPDDRDAFFSWLAMLSADAFPLREIFESRVITLPAHDLTFPMFDCFQHLFQTVNTEAGAISHNFLDVYVEKLIGLEGVWAWAFDCPAEIVSRFFLLIKDIYGNSRQAHATAPHNPELPPLLVETLTRLKNARLRLTVPTEDPAACTRCIERCLMLVEDIVTRSDNTFQFRRHMRQHRMSFFGDALKMTAESNMPARPDVPIDMHSNQPLHVLRNHIAQQCSVQPHVLVIMRDGTALGLDLDRQPLGALGITPLSHISFKLSLDNGHASMLSATANTALEQHLPGCIIAKDDNFWETVFELAEQAHAGIRDHARNLVQLLPTGQARLFRASQCVEPAALAEYLREHLSGAADKHFHLLYHLQIVYSLLRPLLTESPNWPIATFTKAGGLALLHDLATKLFAAARAAAEGDDLHVEMLRLVLSIIIWVLQSTFSPAAPAAAVGEVEAWQRELAAGLFDIVRAVTEYSGSNTPRLLLARDAVHSWWQCLSSHPRLLATIVEPALQEPLKHVLLQGQAVSREALSGLLLTVTDKALIKALVELLLSWYPAAKSASTTCSAFFDAFCGLLRKSPLPDAELLTLSTGVTQWLQNLLGTKVDAPDAPPDALLGGQLQLFAALLTVHAASAPAAEGLLLPLLNDFLFAPSMALHHLHATGELVQPPPSRCTSPASRRAAMAAVVAIAKSRRELFNQTVAHLILLHFSDPDQAKEDKSDAPIVVERRAGGPAGLRNACATCYMNSVVQQLFMQPEIRSGVLRPVDVPDGERADSVLFQVQTMFAHLLKGRPQYYVPEGFWKAYRHWGEPVNVREQQDAREFFDNFVDQVDENLKRLGGEKVISNMCSGVYTDLKKLKGCGHEFERDEVFITLSLNVRHLQSLQASLESHIRPDLVEAYTCETCNEKRECFKSPLFKTLPRTLVVQLKRFDYDWERGAPVKFNDFFEFPMTLDMAPYTLDAARAKTRGEEVPPLPYHLAGVIVHSGQANGGHYYSYIRDRPACGVLTEPAMWMKFDDNEVGEPELMDRTSMERDWFGGEYTASVWDANLRRYENKRKERWWSAYMLVYERAATEEPGPAPTPEISSIITRDVEVHNLEFRHFQDIYSTVYFDFLPRLAVACDAFPIDPATEATSPQVQVLGLALKFITQHGLHAERVLRARLEAWPVSLRILFTKSPMCRALFADFALTPAALRRHLVDTYATDVKNVFGQCLLALIATSEQQKDPALVARVDALTTFAVNLLEVETAQVIRQAQPLLTLLRQCAKLSSTICMLIINQKLLMAMFPLLKHSPKQPLFERGLFYSLVSLAVRSVQLPAVAAEIAATNPYRHQGPSLPCSEAVSALLQPNFLGMLMQSTICEDIENLFRYILWSNNAQGLDLLNIAMRGVERQSIAETMRLYHHLGVMLCVEDPFQAEHVSITLTASSNTGTVALFDTIQRCARDYPRRSYLAIKFVKRMMDRCPAVADFMRRTPKYTEYMTSWLNGRLGGHTNAAYRGYSNEVVAGEHLERSRSAQDLLHALQTDQHYEPNAADDLPPDYDSENSEDEVFQNRR